MTRIQIPASINWSFSSITAWYFSLASSMSVSTSSLLRLKFSMLNAYTVTSMMPIWRHHCIVSVSLLNPIVCPSSLFTLIFFAYLRTRTGYRHVLYGSLSGTFGCRP